MLMLRKAFASMRGCVGGLGRYSHECMNRRVRLPGRQEVIEVVLVRYRWWIESSSLTFQVLRRVFGHIWR